MVLLSNPVKVLLVLLTAIDAIGVTPITFTTAVVVDTLPFLSVTVSTTVFCPRLEQSNVDLSTASD